MVPILAEQMSLFITTAYKAEFIRVDGVTMGFMSKGAVELHSRNVRGIGFPHPGQGLHLIHTVH